MTTLSPFSYDLPSERIAQRPVAPADHAKLLLKAGGELSTQVFHELPSLLPAGAVLVLNDTRVIPARLFGTKESGGEVELLLIEQLSALRWKALGKPMRNLQLDVGRARL